MIQKYTKQRRESLMMHEGLMVKAAGNNKKNTM